MRAKSVWKKKLATSASQRSSGRHGISMLGLPLKSSCSEVDSHISPSSKAKSIDCGRFRLNVQSLQHHHQPRGNHPPIPSLEPVCRQPTADARSPVVTMTEVNPGDIAIFYDDRFPPDPSDDPLAPPVNRVAVFVDESGALYLDKRRWKSK